MTTATARATWHRPVIAEHIVKSPPAAQLTLSSRGPRREHTDHERKARLNAEAQANWRSRQHDPVHKNKADNRRCCTVEYNAVLLDMLVAREWLDDDETGDPKAVGQAISEMLMEAAALHWKETHCDPLRFL